MATDISGVLAALSNPNLRYSSPVSNRGSSRDDFLQMLSGMDRQRQQQQQKIDLAAAGFEWPTGKGSGPSVLSRVIDVISRPLYATSEFTRRAIEPGGNAQDTLAGLWGGLSGKNKTTGVDVVAAMRQRGYGESREEATRHVLENFDAGPKIPGLGMSTGLFTGSLALNIGLDPLTYINPFSMVSKLKGAKTALEVGHGTSKADAVKAGIVSNNSSDVAASYDKMNDALRGAQVARRSSEDINIAQRAAASDTPVSTYQDLVAQQPGFGRIKPGANAPFTPEITPTQLDMPKVQPPVPQMSSPLPNMQAAEAVGNVLRDTGVPKLTRAAEIREGEDLARAAGYANRESAGRAGRREATQAEQIDALGNPVAGPTRTGGGVNLPYRAEDVVAGIARGDLDFLGKAPKRFIPRERMVNAEHANLAADILRKQGVVDKAARPMREFTRKDQAQLWNNAFNAGMRASEGQKLGMIARTNKARMYAYNVLRAAENTPGIVNTAHGATTGTTMSRIIEELGGPNGAVMRDKNLPKLIARAFDTGVEARLPREVMEVVQAARARMIGAEGVNLDQIMKNLARDDNIAEQVMAPGALENFRKGIKNELKAQVNPGKLRVQTAAARGAGAPVSELTTRQAAYKFVQALQKTKKSRPQQIMEIKADYFAKSSKNGKVYTAKFGSTAITAQTRAIERELLENYKNLGTEVGASSRGIDTAFSRLATWAGQKTIRPFYNQQYAQGMAQVGEKAAYLNRLVKDFKPEELQEAFRSIQGLAPVSGRAAEAADELGKIMDIMLDANGMNSIVKRGLVTMKDVNGVLAQLGSSFRFTDKPSVVNGLGETLNFSKSYDWMNSWRAAKIDDPVEFMYKMDNALELVSHKNVFLDEMISRFGSAKYGEGFTAKVPQIARTNGVYFPPEIAQQLANWSKMESKIFAPKSPFIKHLDRVIGAWKSGVTIYAPSHHIRNMIGDLNLAWWAGVNNPNVYRRASKIIFANKNKYSDLQGLAQLSADDAVVALTRGGDHISTTKGGYNMTADDVYGLARNMGILQKAHVGEELIGDPLFKNGMPITKGRVRDFARGLSESRDHIVRLGHFLDILEKSKARNIKELRTVAEKAGQEVRKWHPDGMDLTHAEKTVARRLIPFYSWMRKSTPLIVESLVRSPGKVMLYPKAMYSAQLAMGIKPESYSDPFPIDQLFPDWIKAKNIGPVGQYGLNGPAGILAAAGAGAAGTTYDPVSGFGTAPQGYTVINPSNPFIDFFGTYAANPNNPLKGLTSGILSGLTPAAKIPLELQQDRDFDTGAPIRDKSQYVTENLPIASVIARLAGRDIALQPTRREQRGDLNYQTEAWLNFLTAAGITGTGPLEKSAQIKEKMRG